ncbi:hypothetical protein HPP92_014876 [Vanilla planifolia]|uniref:K Homology domain-containing protein n=1 Tax=Vanilla planifolia TaxID=51239 RepID=A0A835URI3_VANPL|nr:hypothetical protein HPP92_014876 [Vanilla planifolia]
MAAATTDTGANGAAGDDSGALSEDKDMLTSTQSPEDDESPDEAEETPHTKGEPGSAASVSASKAGNAGAAGDANKWPGWPGDSVFRLIVPVVKVGSIIGRKGELIKKICEETRARVRILDGAIGTTDRIVLISAKEEPDAEISPAMDAVLRVFKRVNDISESIGDGADQANATAMSSIRLLVASSQAVHLIGKQGAMIKSIQESTGATIRVLSGDELPYYASVDERVVDILGETLKVLKALESVAGHLRKFLVDHSILPLFEKSLKVPSTQDHPPEVWAEKTQSLLHSSQVGIGSDYGRPLKRDPLYLDQDRGSLSLYGQDPAASGLRSSGAGLGRSVGALVTQVTQTMQIPLSYAEDIIGIGGGNIAYIRRTSGAVLTVQETIGVPDEITVEIKGTGPQVQTAQQLIH